MADKRDAAALILFDKGWTATEVSKLLNLSLEIAESLRAEARDATRNRYGMMVSAQEDFREALLKNVKVPSGNAEKLMFLGRASNGTPIVLDSEGVVSLYRPAEYWDGCEVGDVKIVGD